jgi:predicted nucleic acid-binding protein
MPEFWLDADSFIEPKKGPYGFDIAPGFWKFLEQKASEGIIASSSLVYEELHDEVEDELSEWAEAQKDSGRLFIDPDPEVQATFKEIADYVNARYRYHQASAFLKGADPWIIAHAKAHGGEVVTFEKSAPNSSKPKIPDVANQFEVECKNLWVVLRELGAEFA